MDNLHGVAPDVLRVQLRARQIMKREVIWFYLAFVAGTLGYFAFSFPSLLGPLAYVLFIAVMRSAMVRYQWRLMVSLL